MYLTRKITITVRYKYYFITLVYYITEQVLKFSVYALMTISPERQIMIHHFIYQKFYYF